MLWAGRGDLSDGPKCGSAGQADQYAVLDDRLTRGAGLQVHPVGPSGAAVRDERKAVGVRRFPVLYKPIDISTIHEIHPAIGKVAPWLIDEPFPVTGKGMNRPIMVGDPVGADGLGANRSRISSAGCATDAPRF